MKCHLEQQNKLLKVELTEKTTQLASHKESNFKLTQGIEEAIRKIEEKNKSLEELQLRVESDARVMNEQVGDIFVFENFVFILSLLVAPNPYSFTAASSFIRCHLNSLNEVNQALIYLVSVGDQA